MEYRDLGRTGIKVSPLGLGTDNFMDPTPADESARILNRALDAGINLIDTGDVYAEGEGERVIGKTLRENKRRHEALIVTKVDHGRRLPGQTLEEYEPDFGPNQHGHSRLNIIRACENSLKRLQTDYIDFYLLHRQSPNIPIDEILSAMNDLVRQGKVRYIGCSTFPAWAVMEGILVSEMKGYARFVLEEPPYSLLDRRIENELIPMCVRYGVGIITWAPMAMGVLAGRYTDEKSYPETSRAALRGGFYAERVTKQGIEVGKEFSRLAGSAGLTAAQLAVLWNKDQHGVSAPLIGPRTMEHLENILPVMEMKLDDDLRRACDELVPPGSAVANFHNTAGWMKMKLVADMD
ncbi:MAG: aldo/keto reductase [Deltaproteobacteria bacterium]|nr:aldo/keto reductase [Deltaproteobacteria bacterium]MBW2136610.1 aldo/keto reductase [Deltaproteobacteria bacterium]